MNREFEIRIDDEQHRVNDPVLTGRQLLNLAGKRPVEEHLVYYFTPSGVLEDISLEETVDLRGEGAERFLTFRSDRSFRFELDSRRFDWGAAVISEPTLKKLAGVTAEYNVWLERRAEEDELLERGEVVDLTAPRVERFYTGLDETTAGLTTLLPLADRRYLDTHDIGFQEVGEGSQKGIIFPEYPIPGGSLDATRADVLVQLPGGYPDARPDMFYTDPWLKLKRNGQLPAAANHPINFVGRSWQRWSRHSNQATGYRWHLDRPSSR